MNLTWRDICLQAARTGDTHLLHFAILNDVEWSPYLCCIEMAKYGHKEGARWLLNKASFSRDVYDTLVEQIENTDPVMKTYAEAARDGDIEHLKLLRDKGYPWPTDTCSEAAQWGHLDVLQWLRAQDPPCPWNPDTAYAAARWGDSRMLKWLHQNGFPWQGALASSMKILDWFQNM